MNRPDIKAPWVILILIPLWIVVSMVGIAIYEQNSGETLTGFVDVFFAWFGGALGVWLFVGAPLLTWLDWKRRTEAEAAERTSVPSASSDDDYYSDDDDDYGDGTGRRYPVTDGYYNPDLYRERGGYSTYQAMERWNIDDYDTYKSNIE